MSEKQIPKRWRRSRHFATLPLLAILPLAAPARAEEPAWSVAAVDPVLPATVVADPAPDALAVRTGWTLAEPQASPEPTPGLAPVDPPPAAAEPVYGPPAPAVSAAVEPTYSFGDRLDAVKWETLGLAAYLTAINLPDLLDHPSGFSFEKEGLFGDDTANLGMDKVAHAWNAYILSDVLYWRMKRKTGDSPSSAFASAAIAVGLDIYSEMFDAFKDRSGFSWSDVGFNVLGAGFSFARNSVPGLKEKVDFRLLFLPNDDIYSFNKKEHFRQQRYLFALKLAGFAGLERSPLRFVELHAGYYARGFTDRERARGDRLEQKPFVGIGLNLGELLFPQPRSAASRVARTGLEYLQVPYTAVHVD